MLNLIVPMAGRGSRFTALGRQTPKPIIDFHGQPFFWWAVESVLAHNSSISLTFVVLREHIEVHGIDKQILQIYPLARIIVLDHVTRGAAETAWYAVQDLSDLKGPVGFLDCDHAFDLECLDLTLKRLGSEAYGALCYFISHNPAYSYLIVDEHKHIKGTVEKRVVSDMAIAGLYLFRNKDVFVHEFHEYLHSCSYDELFMSGIFDSMLKNNLVVDAIHIQKHISLGTPEEFERARRLEISHLPRWYGTRTK